MDITPQLLKDIKISDGFRGYNKDEVNELIERVGAAIMQLQGRLRDAIDRAEIAESQASGLAGRSDAEDTLRRTLVLAQRTADAAIAEAQADAARIVAEADEHSTRAVSEADAYAKQTTAEADDRAVRATQIADDHVAAVTSAADETARRVVAEAEAQVAALRAEAEAEVRRVAEESRGPIMDEIRDLERVRSFLTDDISLLERHLDAGRERLRQQIAELNRIVEEPSALRLDPVPATSGISAPVSPPPESGEPDPSVVDETDDAVARDDFDGDTTAAAPDLSPGEAEYETSPAWGDTPAWPEHATDEPAPGGDALDATAERDDLVHDPSDDADDEDDHPGRAAHGGDFDTHQSSSVFDSAPGSETFAEADTGLDFGERTGDQFLDQLRRAVDDEPGLDDDAMAEFFDAEVDDSPRSRFGRRR